MKEFIERTLHQSVLIEETKYLNEKLPLAFKGRYTIYMVKTNDMRWIAIKPLGDASLTNLRKDRARVEKAANLNCAIFLESASFYIRGKLLEERIPFVVKDKLICLPFIGYLVSDENRKDIVPINQISFLTQKLVFTAIYEKWENVTVTEAAQKLGVSKMSATRCFDEIEYLNIDILTMKGKSRAVTVSEDIKKLWNDIKHVLRTPVITRYELAEDIKLERKAGISALCEYSLLSDNEYPTYAVTKKEITNSGIKKARKVQRGEDIGCVVIELGYFIDFNNMKSEDPLSVVLSLTDEEKSEDRVNISVNEMLEEYVW